MHGDGLLLHVTAVMAFLAEPPPTLEAARSSTVRSTRRKSKSQD